MGRFIKPNLLIFIYFILSLTSCSSDRMITESELNYRKGMPAPKVDKILTITNFEKEIAAKLSIELFNQELMLYHQKKAELAKADLEKENQPRKEGSEGSEDTSEDSVDETSLSADPIDEVIEPTVVADSSLEDVMAIKSEFLEESVEILNVASFTDGLDEDMAYWVNKERALSKNFYPTDLELIPEEFVLKGRKIHVRKHVSKQFQKMVAYMNRTVKLSVVALSGYRSYQTQISTFQYWVNYHGSEDLAEKESAWPGHSEHQLGTTIDLTTPQLRGNPWTKFGDTAQAKWLEENAHKFGFTISYQKHSEEITGYIWEPWHIRYVGRPVAKKLYDNKLVLEEFFQELMPGPLPDLHYKKDAEDVDVCADFASGGKQYWTCGDDNVLRKCNKDGIVLKYTCSAGCYTCQQKSHDFCGTKKNNEFEKSFAKERQCTHSEDLKSEEIGQLKVTQNPAKNRSQ